MISKIGLVLWEFVLIKTVYLFILDQYCHLGLMATHCGWSTSFPSHVLISPLSFVFSFVEVSPVRLKVHIYFPEQGGSFNLDLELAGVS